MENNNRHTQNLFLKISTKVFTNTTKQTTKSHAASGFWNILPDELNVFLKVDALVFNDIQSM